MDSRERENHAAIRGMRSTKDKEGNFTQCRAKIDDGCNFCICNGLLSSAGHNPEVEEPLYTVGVNGYRGR